MNMKLPISLIKLLSIFCVVSLFHGSLHADDDTRPVVKIGAILPLSGGLAHLGSAYRNAMILAAEDIPADAKFRYELVFEDNQLDLKTTATAAQKLLSADRVNAVISMWSNQGKIVGPLAAQVGVIHFGCAWDKTVGEGDLSFNLSATPDYFMHHFVEALKKRNIERVNLIELNDSGSISAHDELERQLEGTGIELVLRQQFNSGERDFKPLLLRSKTVDSDLYYLNAGSPELELITRQMRQLGITTPVTTIGTFDFTTELELFNGFWYMTMTWPRDSFQNRFTNRFNTPVVYQLGNFYEMVRLLVEGFERAAIGEDIPSAEQVAAKIKSMKNSVGILGPLLQQEDGTFQSEPSFFLVQDGLRIPLTE